LFVTAVFILISMINLDIDKPTHEHVLKIVIQFILRFILQTF